MTFRHLFATTLCLLPGLTSAEVLSSTNPTIFNNLCVGSACAVNESFSSDFNQIKLKSAVNRIEFEDISTTSGFPTADWALQANEVLSGQRDQFMLQDLTNGTTPLTVSAAAPTNAFFIAPDGDLGLGTSLPQARLNMLTASSSAIRIDRTDIGAGGGLSYEIGIEDFGAFAIKRPTSEEGIFSLSVSAPDLTQVIGPSVTSFNTGRHDYDFEVRGVSLAPLIYADAGTTRVGIGTGTPAVPLHVQRANGTAEVLVENTAGPSAARGMFTMRSNGGSFFTMDNTQAGTTWFFTHEQASPNRFIIADAVADGAEMSLTAGGNLTIQGQLFTAGSCAAGCDRVFEPDYPLPTIAEQAAMMRVNKHLPAVGPTPEDGPFNITAMTGGMLNELEKAHLYIAELEARLAAVEAHLARRD
ncbi:hypothetical protein ACOXXX_18245 [Thalassococcus sp. BH17M4-6]|uniref:hypothetical protein n=1 Tax=Thalassococcus sp. BH17M4-6 TaxID=3413148 RepID=UPI003BBF85F7